MQTRTSKIFDVKIDNQDLPVHQSDVIILTGESKQGKTYTSSQIATSALRQGVNVYYVNEEYNPHNMATRITEHLGVSELHQVLQTSSLRTSNVLDYIEIGKLTEEYKNTKQPLLVVLDIVTPPEVEDLVALTHLADATGVALTISTNIRRALTNLISLEEFSKTVGARVIEITQQEGQPQRTIR